MTDQHQVCRSEKEPGLDHPGIDDNCHEIEIPHDGVRAVGHQLDRLNGPGENARLIAASAT
jgi:hypothetical protein